jgi:hypothetical protein
MRLIGALRGSESVGAEMLNQSRSSYWLIDDINFAIAKRYDFLLF